MIDNRHPLYLLALSSLALPGKQSEAETRNKVAPTTPTAKTAQTPSKSEAFYSQAS